MLFVRINKPRLGANLRQSVIRINKRKYSVPAVSQNDETTAPTYPPIQDLSYTARHRRIREQWAADVQRVHTVEEKMIKINMPRYYGWNSVMLREGTYPYNCTDQMQYYTRTHVVNKPGLPSYYDNVITPENLQATVDNLKESIEDGLVFEYSSRKWKDEIDPSIREKPKDLANIMSKAVSKQVHRSLMNQLAKDKPHLLEAEIDNDPRIEAFWFVGGIPPPQLVVKRRAAIRMPADIRTDPVDRPIQYLGTPNMQLRHRLPLPEIISLSDSENPDFTVPQFKYEPRVTGLHLERRHGTNIPGFWPGDISEFGVVSYHNSGYLAIRKPEFNDASECLKVQAILGSWGWLLSQACNLGFSPFNDITYPLTNQMIITNGKWWTFCVYQLNTTVVHSKHIDENPRRNICWMSEPMKLFDKIENDKVHGLNDEVLANLVKFYANEPRERADVELKPYLTDAKYVCNIRGLAKRAWLEDAFKHVMSNRPRHRRLPEVYNWQQIYLQRHKTRPMDKKREQWEFGVNMWHRKLNQHHPKYIPKCMRTDGTRHQKWQFTYWP